MVMNTKKAYESSWKGWEEYDPTPPLKEGFQSPSAECPAESNTFPLQLGFAPTENVYEQVLDDLFIDIQYGQSANPPEIAAGSISVGEINETTLLYKAQQLKYTLDSIQIINASHSTWLLKNGDQNKKDILLYFKRGDGITGGPKYIAFVIPILSSTTYTNQNKLLQSLTNKSLQGPFLIRDCFPEKNTLFLRYSSCLQTTAGGQNTMDVFVSSIGLPLKEEIANALVPKSITAPEGTLLDGTPSVTEDNFPLKITSSRDVVEVAKSTSFKTSSQVIRADSTSAYKCLPFDPDGEVTDGKIRVDLDSGLIVNAEGQALTDVLEARAKVREEDKGRLEAIAPGNWEKGITITLAVIFCIIAIGLFVALAYTFIKGGGSVATGAAAAAAAPANP
jgi:hypothetical protein